MTGARYDIVEDDFQKLAPLVIRDVGPWERHPTVTNDAESVVNELHVHGRLPKGRRLLYYDSDGDLAELLHEDGRFVGFAP